MTRYHSAPPIAVRRETPVRGLALTDLTVPAGYALVGAFLVTLFVLAALGFLDQVVKDAGMTWRGKLLAAASSGLGSGVAILALLIRGLYFSQQFLYSSEEIYGIDINHDGQIGRPQQVDELHLDPQHLRRLHYPCAEEQMLEFLRAAVRGSSLSYAAWRGKFADPVDGADSYAKVRQWLVREGLMLERGNHGAQLTPLGRVWAEQKLAGRQLPPPPDRISARIGASQPPQGLYSPVGEWGDQDEPPRREP